MNYSCLLCLFTASIFWGKVSAFTTCQISLLTVNFVDKCPTDKISWEKAAARLNCASVPQSCSQSMSGNAQYFAFQYHCVINAWRNATLEVCAPNRTILGYCAEFNLKGAMIQDNYDADCTKHDTPCPTSYDSAEAYKYQTCYEIVGKNRQRESEKIMEPISISNRAVGSLIQTLNTTFLVILLRTPSIIRRGNCCAGSMYDVNSSSCIACRTGFIGKNCEKTCPYPMYGDGCQQRCFCGRTDCNITVGCVQQTTVENGSRVSNTTDSTTFTSGTILSTPVGYEKTSLSWSSKESNRTLEQETAKQNNLAKFAETTQTSTKITSTKLNRPEVVVVNGQTPLLVGIFSFNALFVLVIIAVASYCVCRKYKNYRKRKKDNSATVIHYHEIDENAVGTSREYDPLYTTQVSEIPKDFLVDYENEPFNRERQSCQISDSDLQHRSSYTTPKCLIHEEELPSTRKSTEDKQEADFTDDGQIYLTCQN